MSRLRGPLASPTAKTSARMRATVGRDNEKEWVVRSALHRLGCRFRVHYPVPGAPRRSIDMAFPSIKVAVFIDGCFWHACPVHGTMPKVNADWWRQKIARNFERDRETDRLLVQAGWQLLRFWEHTDDREIVQRVFSMKGALTT